MMICSHCGRAMCNDGTTCSRCRTSEGATAIVVPYNFKLLLQEMTCCGIGWEVDVS